LTPKVRRAHADLDFFDLGRVTTNLEDAYAFARREVSPEFADYILDSFNSCMMFSRSTDTSSAAFLSLFSMMADPAYDFSVFFADGDMRAIPEALAARLVVHRGCPVDALKVQEGGWMTESKGETSCFNVVMAATRAALAMPRRRCHRRLLAETRSTINVSFRIPKETLGRTHCFYVPYIVNRIISEFTNEALKGEHTTHEGTSLVNVGLHEEAALALMDSPDATIFERVRTELLGLNANLREVAERVQAYDLERWPEAIPKYDCGQITRVKAFLRDEQGRQGLYLCGDYMNAPWIEGASRSGRKAAAQLLREVAQRPSN
jgi:protoporphyrinogen oxidase